MPRPAKCRCVRAEPGTSLFKPSGVPLKEMNVLNLTLDEFEALRLADMEGRYHEDAAGRMKVSRQTFGNILSSARKKTAQCLAKGFALRIQGGTIRMRTRKFQCCDCGHVWDKPCGTDRPPDCPSCRSGNLHRHHSQGGRGNRSCGRAGHGKGGER